MKFSTLSVLATIVCSATAVDIWLFKNANSCSGDGRGCQNVASRICCRVEGQLFGSVQFEGDHPAGSTGQAYSLQNNDYCRVPLGPRKPIPVCIITGLEDSVSGGVWFESGQRRRRMPTKEQECDGVVQDADYLYKDGDKIYIIRHESLAKRSDVLPTDEQEKLEYFKQHADEVVDSDTNIPIQKETPAAVQKD